MRCVYLRIYSAPVTPATGPFGAWKPRLKSNLSRKSTDSTILSKCLKWRRPVWPLPPVPLAGTMHHPGYLSPCVRSIDWPRSDPALDRSGEGIGNGLEAPRYVFRTSRHGSLLVLSEACHHERTASFLDPNLSEHVLLIILELEG